MNNMNVTLSDLITVRPKKSNSESSPVLVEMKPFVCGEGAEGRFS